MADDATNASALSLADLNISINHEPRVSHLRLAGLLGYQQPHKLAHLIERHREALERFGVIPSTVDENRTGRGRPGQVHWLNKRQALYLCTKSETPNATEATIAMVEVFDAWTAGRLPPPEQVAALPPPLPPEEPPFCAGCAARQSWNMHPIFNREFHILRERPIDHADMKAIQVFREAVEWALRCRLQDKAGAVLTALGLPAPQPPEPPARPRGHKPRKPPCAA